MPNWKKLIVSGSDAALNSLNVTSALTASGLNYPTSDGTDGQVLLTDGSGVLTFGDNVKYVTVRNVSSGTLTKGTPVHSTGTSGNAPEVIAASASLASAMPANFVLAQNISAGAEGRAVLSGFLNGVDTNGFDAGSVIYVAPTGSYTNTKPEGDGNLIQNVAIVGSVGVNGSLFVYGSGRSNDIPNLPEGKIWVGSSNYTVTSSVAHLDESNGRLGIGTTSPTQKLDVRGNILISGSSNALFIKGDGSKQAKFSHDGAGLTIEPITQNQDLSLGSTSCRFPSGIKHYGGDHIFYTGSASSEAVRIDKDTGYLGIGTSSPDEALTVVGNVSASGDLYAQGGQVFLGGAVYALEQVSGNYGIRNSSGNYGGNDGSGAYSTPQDFLHIPGTARFGPKYSTSDRDYIKIIPSGVTSSLETRNEKFLIENTQPSGDANIELSVGTGNLFITGSGNVGIGTNNPSEALSVEGNTCTSGLTTTNTLTVTGLSNQGSEATALMINGSNVVGTRELGSNAFSSTTFVDTSGTPVDNQVAIFTDADTIEGSSNLTFDGTNLTVGGKLTATEIVTNVVSQSISFATGSNRFGDEISDTHTFTGSLNVTGSLGVTGNLTISAGHIETDQIYLADKILHSGDSDTYIAFENNTHRYFAAGEEMIKFNSSLITLNEAGGNNDIRIKGNSDTNLFYSDGSADKIGIGTESPLDRLHVEGGDIRIRGASSTSDLILDHNGTHSGSRIRGIRDTGPDAQDFGSSALQFLTNDNSTTSAEVQMTLSSEGKLQIGSGFAPEKLTVEGNISGSGCIQIGTGHTLSGTKSSIGGGINHTITGNCSFIGGGCDNCITGNCSFVGGGRLNDVLSTCSVIAGGYNNSLSATVTAIAGGRDNCITSTGACSFIGGGYINRVQNLFSTIGGGCSNCIQDRSSFIGGGEDNCTNSDYWYNVIGGGCNNTISGTYSGYHFIGGGQNNSLSGTYVCHTTIAGGYANCITGDSGTIGGGAANDVYGRSGTIAGGSTNMICSGEQYATIGGGRNNTVDGDCSTIAGGAYNCITANAAIIAGGTKNTGSGACSFVGGGCGNTITDELSVIGGGKANCVTSGSSVIGGGCDNCITGIYDFVGGGKLNCILNAKCSVVVGGEQNRISGSASSRYHFLGGGFINRICVTDAAQATPAVSTLVGGFNNCISVGGATIVGGTSNTNSGYEGFIGGGNAHTVSGCYSSVVAGRLNCVTGCCSAVVNGCTNCVTANLSFIGGGTLNTGSGACGVIGGGCLNQICSGEPLSFIGGGCGNIVDGDNSIIVGGLQNCVHNNSVFIGGGFNNKACGVYGVIGGGFKHEICTGEGCSAILGGYCNTIDSDFSFIGGGCRNIIAQCNCNVIVGGRDHCITGRLSFIGGGCQNDIVGTTYGHTIAGGMQQCICTTSHDNTIGGGQNNKILCNIANSTIAGGASNTICRTSGFDYGSTIAGGAANCLIGSTCWGFIGGGACNTGSAPNVVVAGGRLNSSEGNCSAILGGCGNTASGTLSTVGGGKGNLAEGDCSFVAGGTNNRASGLFSFAGGEGSLASAAQSFAFGYFVTASGGAAAAFGALTQADGFNAFAVGTQNLASSTDTVAFGYQTCAVASQSMATGYQTCAAGASSLAGGGVSCAIGGNSIAWGTGNCACGTNSVALGCFNTARNSQSFVAGISNCIGTSALTTNTIFGASNCINAGENNLIAGGTGLVSVGSYNFIGGQCNSVLNDINTSGFATIFGFRNCANGCASYSFSHGRFNLNFSYAGVVLGQGSTAARGDQQFAFGCCVTNPNNGTSANIANSMVIGRYNVYNTTNCHLFAVGNGSNDISRTNAFNVSSNGRVGVCCIAPQSALDVNGTTRTTTLVETSARRYKENIISLQDQLDNLKKLEPVEFEWKETKKKDIGLIAEDVEKIYPHLVEHDDNGDLMGVKYSKLTSVLVKALQEQQEQIDELKAEVKLLNKK